MVINSKKSSKCNKSDWLNNIYIYIRIKTRKQKGGSLNEKKMWN